jgi:hypothetical protein
MNKTTWVGAALISMAGMTTVGCGDAKPVDDDLAALRGIGDAGKRDDFAPMMLGELRYGESTGAFRYHAPPVYRIVPFTAAAGDHVELSVTSPDGDPVAWILDLDLNVLGFADDDADGLDAHIQARIPADGLGLYLAVVREYDLADATFTIGLEGRGSCTRDEQCAGLAVERGELAVCEAETGQCVAAKADEIACGGHTINPHGCPGGWQCMGAGLAFDAPGSCVQQCGGFAFRPCDGGLTCADDPLDACDPGAGGADCGGLCVEGESVGCDLLGCADGGSCELVAGAFACVDPSSTN